MSTFAQPRTLTQRISDAKRTLDLMRREGYRREDIEAATNVLDGYLDRLPRREMEHQ